MTDRPSSPDALAARAEALRQRRAGAQPPPRGSRRHVARRSRVASAVVGIGATIFMVGALEAAGRTGAAAPPPTTAMPELPTVVVQPETGAPPSPVRLVAPPTVRAVRPSTTATTARSHGSR
jgi:hypothetical protein